MGIPAEYIWMRDTHREYIALKNGYKYLAIWETEIKNERFKDELAKFCRD